MGCCDHCEGQRFDRARVLRLLRTAKKKARKTPAAGPGELSAEQALAAAIQAVRGLDIPHLERFDDIVEGELVH